MSERPKPYLITNEIKERGGEWKRQQAKLHLDFVFSEESTLIPRRKGLPITESSEGNERVRAYIPDEDAHLAYSDNASYVGVVKLSHNGRETYLAERYFPHREGQPTYMYQYETATGDLAVTKLSGDPNQEQFELPKPADAEAEDHFLYLSRAMAYAFGTQDYEARQQHLKDEYIFKLDDLK